jgi:hypothetical protein
MWLTGRLVPDHKTIADFRKDNGRAIRQDRLFKEAVASRGETIRSQLAVFLHDKHERTSDPLGDPREMKEPDSLGG